ncbi:high nitrogen upregulated cytochrome P450 monooxygenase 1 [Irpex rosettiformis]|uniref:High nitrogen upregulated cytochrome P450 monooxygenase 1 n=1 Tax=Irpex rosettiformis TaxID=378272 RepID=A0ACB8UGH7_9APHY|nr:high nitrogen upregulated cytochrome P450 monooxygenase 1 [Irpex rosettiformis]
MKLLFTQSAAIPIATASLLVYQIFKRYEPQSIPALLLLLLVVPGALVPIVQTHFITLLGAVLTTYISYWSLILIFTVAYRLSPFHPLAKYPGPLLCKISKIWFTYLVGTGGKAHLYVYDLHKRYNSDIVRIGPNEISVTHADLSNAVLGVKGLPRGPYYNTRTHEAGVSLDGLRDQALHTVRRRPWSRGMSSTSMKYYEELVHLVVREFVTSLSQRAGKVVDFTEWATFFGVDFMGHMAFTHDYGMIKNGRDDLGLINLIENAMIDSAWISHIPWAVNLLQYLFGANKSWNRIKIVGEQTVKARVAAGSREKDLFYHLIDEEGHESVRPTVELCAVDGQVAVIAGADTAATILGHLCYFLQTNSTYFDRLRNEVDEKYPHGIESNADLAQQATMPYLNACINEALRLFPPVLTGLQRRVEEGTGGRMIGPYFIPEGTQVSPWAYVVHRDPQHYSPLPDTFWPDRWLSQDTYVLPTGDVITQDKLVTNREVFMPFSLGPMVCVGKNVALMEIRAVLCAVVRYFDIEVADKACFERYESEIHEIFTTKRGPLPVRLRVRMM